MTSLERDRIPNPRPIAAKEAPLVDRTEEMNVLKEAVYRGVHGEGGLVFIHGEAGIGKTRLVRELGAYARSRCVQVLYGRCPARAQYWYLLIDVARFKKHGIYHTPLMFTPSFK